jgi:hypothetical protein
MSAVFVAWTTALGLLVRRQMSLFLSALTVDVVLVATVRRRHRLDLTLIATSNHK